MVIVPSSAVETMGLGGSMMGTAALAGGKVPGGDAALVEGPK